MSKENNEKKTKTDVAAALRYQPDQNDAPVVVAGGKGHMAGYIREVAEQHGIPLHRDETLARTLVQLGTGTEIPESLYQVVAEILIHVARIDKQFSK